MSWWRAASWPASSPSRPATRSAWASASTFPPRRQVQQAPPRPRSPRSPPRARSRVLRIVSGRGGGGAAAAPSGSAGAAGRSVVAGVALLVAAIWAGIPVLRWRTTTYERGTRRLRMRAGILSRSGRDIPLNRVNDVSFSHGPIDRMLGCGKLVVESAREHGQLVLTESPHGESVQSALD